jgi:hypothetical protein
MDEEPADRYRDMGTPFTPAETPGGLMGTPGLDAGHPLPPSRSPLHCYLHNHGHLTRKAPSSANLDALTALLACQLTRLASWDRTAHPRPHLRGLLCPVCHHHFGSSILLFPAC